MSFCPIPCHSNLKFKSQCCGIAPNVIRERVPRVFAAALPVLPGFLSHKALQCMESMDWTLDSTSAVVIYYHYFLGLGKITFHSVEKPLLSKLELQYLFVV